MKLILISTLLAFIMIGGAIILPKIKNNPATPTSVHNIAIIDGKQIITISAKGGYQPRKSIAKAGTPTIVRFETSGTFDCSSIVRIPSMDISKTLPQTGSTDINIGSHEISVLQGSCGMGMYPFEIEFQ